jgi:UDP-N-acetylglucosamine--N-acetylmuramyl-(pentapeptide) pyrophosphoryl-undecaprenol N-acetylglucosamine transferase
VRIVITGGGTGGHVYPALEVARFAQEEADLLYMGSLRGMEGDACSKRGMLFQGFDTGPVYNVKSIQGAIALAKIFKASLEAKKALKIARPDIVFSTGGYSSAPVMRAAKSLGIKLAIHACDTVPGRSLRMYSDYARVITSTFEATKLITGAKTVRTGHPIRSELRQAVKNRQPESRKVIVLGGSGGAKFLNETIPNVAPLVPDVQFLLSAGKAQYDQFKHLERENLKIVPYLEAEQMSEAYRSATLVIGRSGSGISEYAMAGIPSILIPLPTSADNHQFENAKEFVSFGGASLLVQGESTEFASANPTTLAEEIMLWLNDSSRQNAASEKLKQWDRPNSTADIWKTVVQATQ